MKTKLLITILLSCFIISASAQIIHVPLDQPNIQAGINVATTGDTVLVDTGTYYENINFWGKAITVASNFILDGDTNYINNTIINGSQPVNPDFASVVSFTTGEDTTSIISGFTITGGTDEFEGITGGSDMISRAAFGGLSLDTASGSAMRTATGLVVWPNMKVNIPKMK